MTDDRRHQNKGRIDAPWFKFFPAKFITMTAELNPSEVGGFVRLLCAIHVNGEAIVDDSKRLARRVGLRNAKAFDALRATLLDAGLIEVKDGLLSSPFSQDVFANITIADTHPRKNVSAKKAKTEKNQSKNPVEEEAEVEVEVEADTEVDAQAPSEPVQSHTSHTSDSDDAPARDSAGSRTYRADEPFTLPDVGDGYVSTVISRRPVIFTAIIYPTGTNDALNFIVKPKPDGKFETRQISDQEATNLHYKHAEDDDDAA